MRKISIFLLLIPFILLSQNKKNSFLVLYPTKIKISNELVNESNVYLNYEKNRSINSSKGKINSKLKEEIDSLTIEKIIGNVTLQSLQYYFFEAQPKNKYHIKDNNLQITTEEFSKKEKTDFIVSYTDLEIYLDKKGELKLKFKLTFYETETKKYLIQDYFEADENNQGGMWGCSEYRFKCIVNNTLRIGTEEVAKKYWKYK